MTLRFKLLLLIIPALLSAVILSVGIAAVLFYKQTPVPFAGLWAALLLAFIGSSIIALLWSVTGSASRSLQGVVKVTHRIAQGDFGSELPKYSNIREVQELLTAMSQMQQSLKQYEKTSKEEEVYRKLGKMTSHVAHDLASPLSSMQAALGYFSELKTLDAKTPDYVNLLELSSRRLKAISKELLDYRKGREPKKILFSLHKVLDELIGEYAAQPQYECVEFVKQYYPESVFVFGDRAKIQRAFGNLIKNAIEAMDKCGTVTVATRQSDDKAVIEIQDTGSGMAPEVLERVLLGGYSQGKAEGHGIGTTVVQQTLAEHGGSLKATSEIGIGTTFCAALPLPISQQVREADREEELVEAFEIISKRGEPVVIIDDDLAFLEQWRLTLERKKKAALLCTSFEDFLEQRITTRLSTTAIVDYHFENSELNGVDILRKLKAVGFENLYLCTVEYWKPMLKKQAEELGVKICPKPLPKIHLQVSQPAGVSVPQEKRIKGGYKVLVIDDELMIRMAWEVVDRTLQIEKLYAFANLEAMEAGALDLRDIDIAFVDKNISGSRFSGADVVNYLKARGVPKVILASGESEELLRNDPQFAQADFVISEKIPTSFKAFFS